MLNNISRLRQRLVETVPQLRPESSVYRWFVLFAVSIGTFMATLDGTIVNVALATLMAAFGVATNIAQWAITGYLLVFAVMMAASGWLSDHLGYKRTFLLALALFTLGSALCSLSWSMTALIAFRVVQGFGGGLIQPLAMALMMREFPRDKRGVAMGIYSFSAFASMSFGPTLGGWLIDTFSWHLIFDINVPIGVFGILVCLLVLREHRTEDKEPFDLAGFASIAIFLSSILLALTNGNADWNTDGWTSPFILSCFAISGVSFIIFLVVELRSAHPLIHLSLFKYFNFSLANVMMIIFGLGMLGADFLLPLYLQNGLGYSPRQAGAVFLPMGLALAVMAIVSGRLTDKIGPRIPGLIGAALMLFGFYRYTALSLYTDTSYVMTNILIMGAGMGLVSSPLQTAAISQIPTGKNAQASGLMGVIKQVGGSFGVAILGTVLASETKGHVASLSQTVSATSSTFKAVLSNASHFAMHATGGTPAQATSMGQSLILGRLEKQAFVSAIGDCFSLALVILSMILVPLLCLKRIKKTVGSATPAVEKSPPPEADLRIARITAQ